MLVTKNLVPFCEIILYSNCTMRHGNKERYTAQDEIEILEILVITG
ncbi:hypothetical protein BH18THE2_BH18THE2_14680 [soil metagenome]